LTDRAAVEPQCVAKKPEDRMARFVKDEVHVIQKNEPVIIRFEQIQKPG